MKIGQPPAERAQPTDAFADTLWAATQGQVQVPKLKAPPEGRNAVPQREVVARPQDHTLRDPEGGGWRLMDHHVLGRGSLGEVVMALNQTQGTLYAAKKIATTTTYKALDEATFEANAMLAGNSPLTPIAVLHHPGQAYLIEPLMPFDLCAVGAHTVHVDPSSHLPRHGMRREDDSRNRRSIDGFMDAPQARAGLALLTLRCVVPPLRQLHRNGFAHCDISPHNVFVRNDQVRLGDWDYVRALHHPNHDTKWRYAPPESFQKSSQATQDLLDRWCLGATVLEVASGMRFACLGSQEAAKKFHRHTTDAWSGAYGRLPSLTQTWQREDYTSLGRKLALLPERTADIVLAFCSMLASTPPPLRAVILGLMHPEPEQRTPLNVLERQLDMPTLTTVCDTHTAAARLVAASRRRARALAQELVA